MASKMVSKVLPSGGLKLCFKPSTAPSLSLRSMATAAASNSQAQQAPSSDLAKSTGQTENLSVRSSENAGRGLARRGRGRDILPSLFPARVFDLWSPLTTSRSMRQMMDTMNRLFDADMFLPGPAGSDARSVAGGRTPWDIVEKADAYHMRIDVPGFEKEDVKVSLQDEELVIKAEKSGSEEVFDVQRSMNTRMLLPPEALKDQIKAELKNGVLTIIVPKEQVPEEKKHRVINVE